MRNGVSIKPRKGNTASAPCIQFGKSGNGMTMPEKKKMAGDASRLRPSPEIVQNKHTVSKATNEAARSNPASIERENKTPASTDAGGFKSRNSPATIKIGMDLMSNGAARPLSARINQTEYRSSGRVIS